MYNEHMPRKILKSPKSSKPKLKFYFPTKISWNPFSYLDRKAKWFPKNVAIAFILFISIMIPLNNEKQIQNSQVLGAKNIIETNQAKIDKWLKITQEVPDYRDGWLQLAISYYEAGEIEKAKGILQISKNIDPNNESILWLEDLWKN